MTDATRRVGAICSTRRTPSRWDEMVEDLSAQHFDAVLQGTVDRDPASATELFRRFHPQLHRYLAARERRHADDLEADVWLAVAANIERFSGSEREFRAWIFTLARNTVTGHRRKGLRRRTDVAGPEVFTDRPGSDRTDEVALDAVATDEALELLRRHLTATQAEVVRLRVIAGLSAAEVADVMGRTETWVRVTQHRALLRLAQRLPGGRR
jgi:RNA polymerase sigma-70 factor (ECF subfamily)